MKRTIFAALLVFWLSGNAQAIEYMQTRIMKVSSTPSLVTIPSGEGIAYNGRRWYNGDKYEGFSFNMDMRSYFSLGRRSMLFADLMMSSGHDSQALHVSPYLKTGFGMVHRLTPRIRITGYVVPSFILGGTVTEFPWVNSFRGITRQFSYATARPWSEYEGVELENFSLVTLQVAISY